MGGKEGKSRLDVSNPYLRQRRESFCKEGLGMDSSLEYRGVDQSTSFTKL